MKQIILLLFCSFIFLHAALTPSSMKKLQNIQQHIDKEEYKQAKEILKVMVKSESKMVQSYAYQSYARIYLEQDNYNKAIKSYEKILKLEAFKSNDLNRIRLLIAQLYLTNNNYKKALFYAKNLLNIPVINKEKVYEILSLSYYYNEEYKKSIQNVKKLIEIKKESLKKYQNLKEEEKKKISKPKLVQWYEILYASYLELEQYKKALNIIQLLIEKHESKESYWMQMVLVYQNLNQPKKVLSTLEMAYDNKLISQKQNLMYFINSLLQEGLYNKAAFLLEKGLKDKLLENNKKNFELLVTSHINAKNIEHSIKLLNHSKYALNEKFQLILGNLYYNEGQYQQLIKTFSKNHFKKGSKKDGQKEILMALSYYELGNEDKAKQHLIIALKNKHEKKQAKSLMKQLGYKL